MTSAFASDLDALFAEPNISREAVYTSDGGAPVLVRVGSRQVDSMTDFGDARLWSETTQIDLRVANVANPRSGDRIEIDGVAFLIQGEPVRDRERLVWTVDLRPARS
ncbi:head-tail joining protein [Phycobacter sp. K97]|uniref:head-tail joining protein n=1 Tax=Phycobacter sedimenti TaxID=3133977 RepID=UPI00311EB0CF